MKRLILMRHAKSLRGEPALDDHARSLNDRGRNAARRVGAWMRARGYLPDEILSSDSRRTRETVRQLGIAGETHFLNRLYLAQAGDMLEILRSAAGECVLMLGHNPGICLLARVLVAAPPPHPRFFDFPTCATLVCDFDVRSWGALAPGSGRAVDFVIPRDLPD